VLGMDKYDILILISVLLGLICVIDFMTSPLTSEQAVESKYDEVLDVYMDLFSQSKVQFNVDGNSVYKVVDRSFENGVLKCDTYLVLVKPPKHFIERKTLDNWEFIKINGSEVCN
jgi:hypothetical protein